MLDMLANNKVTFYLLRWRCIAEIEKKEFLNVPDFLFITTYRYVT